MSLINTFLILAVVHFCEYSTSTQPATNSKKPPVFKLDNDYSNYERIVARRHSDDDPMNKTIDEIPTNLNVVSIYFFEWKRALTNCSTRLLEVGAEEEDESISNAKNATINCLAIIEQFEAEISRFKKSKKPKRDTKNDEEVKEFYKEAALLAEHLSSLLHSNFNELFDLCDYQSRDSKKPVEKSDAETTSPTLKYLVPLLNEEKLERHYSAVMHTHYQMKLIVHLFLKPEEETEKLFDLTGEEIFYKAEEINESTAKKILDRSYSEEIKRVEDGIEEKRKEVCRQFEALAKKLEDAKKKTEHETPSQSGPSPSKKPRKN